MTLFLAIRLAFLRTFILAIYGISCVANIHVTTSTDFDSPQVSAFPNSKFYLVLATLFNLAMFKNDYDESTPRPQPAVDDPIPQHKSTTLSSEVMFASDNIFLRRSTPS
jgi:hypothetical protein